MNRSWLSFVQLLKAHRKELEGARSVVETSLIALLSTYKYLSSALLLLTVSALHPNRAVEGALFVFFGKESINFPMDLTSIIKTTFIFLTSKGGISVN